MDSQYEYFTQMGLVGLVKYFDQGQEESERLEFKSGDFQIANLHKEVCALANTDGGVIILGAPKEAENITNRKSNKKEQRKVCKGNITPSKEDKTCDSIIQLLMTGITPAINSVKVTKLNCDDGFVYIIGIPNSIYSPHQVNSSGVYYMRAGTMSLAAPHGFVHALFNKRKPTKINHKLAIKVFPQIGHYWHFKFQIHISNESRFPMHNTEGFIALIGDLHEVNTMNFEISITPHQKWYMRKNIKSPSALFSNFWWSPKFNNIYVHGEYFYMQLYLWAQETEAITKLYKIRKDGTYEETDMGEDNANRREVDVWNGLNIVDDQE